MSIDTLTSSPAGELAHGEVRLKINEMIEEVNTLLDRQHFYMSSSDTISIGDDPDNPSYVTGLVKATTSTDGIVTALTGASLDTDEGAVQNNSGRTLTMTGTFSYQPDNTGAASRVEVWSERSSDGATWTENAGSARSVEVSSANEASGTKFSAVSEWLDGEYLRFAMYDSGSGSISYVPLTLSVNGGTDNASGPSFVWALEEVF